ncbi:MAG: hypothetical protein HKO12_10580 [Woeseiaceae bacterium]|nr:hypothetical protein [Woeseiaceae bacterium]
MIALFLILTMIAGILILPGWYWANKGLPQSVWICLLPATGLALWAALTALGFGAQSLANLVETPLIASVAVVVAYLKFIVFDRKPALNSYGTVFAIAAVILATILLRTFMPDLPE